LEIGLESLYRLPVAKGIYLSFTPKSLYRLPVAKGIYLSFTPKSLWRTPYHAGLSLIYNRRVCGGPPTTQVYLSFTTEEFAEDPLPRRFISHSHPESLRRTPYHAGLSLIYTPRVCGGPPTTQVYLSFTTFSHS